ncbi:hypothetical protein NDU88_007641 [Pleurodeles waltl]|uniref:Uncharacterized protein n=1 Tax=Pleurodeles waltl TaxID=8319 RepID=A0AAV7NVI8_PLEWA|nr:hypothetical protein NDU88_007641 [Pleurodeles waltl]
MCKRYSHLEAQMRIYFERDFAATLFFCEGGRIQCESRTDRGSEQLFCAHKGGTCSRAIDGGKGERKKFFATGQNPEKANGSPSAA